MRFISMFVVLFALAKAIPSGAYAENTNAPLRVIKNSGLFSLSAEFDFKNGSVNTGKVVRTGGMSPRYFYDLFDSAQNFQARGITRALSWGALYSWGVEIDLYDEQGTYIGLVQGQTFTRARAKFSFYDGKGMPTIVAYLNTETPEFLVVSAQDEGSILAKLQIDNYGDVGAVEMSLLQGPLNVDERVFKIFSAFVADYNREFLPPPKVINNTVVLFIPTDY